MKKLIFVVALSYGTYWYITRHFNLSDVLICAKKNHSASWAPAADYYVGLVYYQRAEYAKSEEAFTQLLSDYTTGPYIAKGLLLLSSVAQENRNWPVARQSLERFIKEFPHHKDKQLAEQRLEFVKFK